MKTTVKFLSWMFVMLFAFTFASCSDDDDEGAPANPYVNTTWEYMDIYEDGSITSRVRFADEVNAYFEVEMRNAGGTIVENTSSPYEYACSGDFIVFKPLQTGKANLEARVSDGIRMVLVNTSTDDEIGIFYKK